MEILDEEAQDLLQSGGGASFPAHNVTTNEWEGPHVQGVQWVQVPSSAQLNDFFKGGCRNKTSRSNEFGRMRDKAAQLFQIEVKQSMLNAATGENQVIVSRVNILSTPGCEVLNEDPEALRAKQGADLNKGILSLNSLLRDLAATPHGDYANYDNSLLTQLSRDIYGGNSLSVGIFCLQYGDAVGSALSLRALQRCQSIMNFPVQNDNRVLGLLRKFRVQIKSLQQRVEAVGGGRGYDPRSSDGGLRVAELEKKLIDQNINGMKAGDDRDRLV